MSIKRLILVFVVGVASIAGAFDAQPDESLRFQSMDRNGDNVITRAEWAGSERSFESHDWNHDGVLAGDEVRLGVRRQELEVPDFDTPDQEYVFADWTTRGFRALDHNQDGRITRDEWHFDREGFRYADHNNDGVITRAEFFNDSGEDDDRDDRFLNLDVDGDGRVSLKEWHASPARFAALDSDGDGFLTRAEVLGTTPPSRDLFDDVDTNRDGTITPDEWHWSRASFNARDSDRNGRLTREEVAGTRTGSELSAAYKAGFERGQIEGRQAGRDERAAQRPWDLEGQRELESADSGYVPSLGPRAEYQSGYRDGFRRGYRQGWDESR